MHFSFAPNAVIAAVPTPTLDNPRLWQAPDGWWFAEAFNRSRCTTLIGAAGRDREGCLARLSRNVEASDAR